MIEVRPLTTEKRIEEWKALTHVCQRCWRRIVVFQSPHRLVILRYFHYTYTTPETGGHTLEVWPPLPFIACDHGQVMYEVSGSYTGSIGTALVCDDRECYKYPIEICQRFGNAQQLQAHRRSEGLRTGARADISRFVLGRIRNTSAITCLGCRSDAGIIEATFVRTEYTSVYRQS